MIRVVLMVIVSLVLASAVIFLTAIWVPRIYGWSGQSATVGDVFTAASAILAGLAFVGIVLTIIIQGQQLRLTSRLTTTAILFEYYNNKISSLREAIGARRNVEANERKVQELLEKHGEMLRLLEEEFRKEIGGEQ